MKDSIIKGVTFGLTSAAITTLGLMVGLNSGTHSKAVVFGGIVTIAVADAFSDSLGIHISEESENKHTEKEIWAATIVTFVSKFLFAMTFIIPVMLFRLETAVAISIFWGLSAISLLSYFIAKEKNVRPWKVIGEHLLIAVIVIIITHYIGYFVSGMGSGLII